MSDPSDNCWWCRRKRESTDKPALETVLTQAVPHRGDNAQWQTKNNISPYPNPKNKKTISKIRKNEKKKLFIGRQNNGGKGD